MLFLVLAAAAAPLDALTDDSVARALAGDCPAAEAGLLRRVDASADDIPARLALAACRYGGTEVGAARADLEALYRVGAPFDPGLLAKRRGVDPADLARVAHDAPATLLLLVRTMVAKQALDEARVAIAELAPIVGDAGAVVAAEVLLERTQNGPKLAWPIAARGVGRFPEDLDLLEESARLVFDDAANALPAVVDAVLARGRSTAKMNTLLGYVRAGRAAECLERGDRTSVPPAERAQLDGILYRCAAAAGNLARADALRAAARPPFDDASTIQHARLLDAAGREAEALSLVQPLAARQDAAADVAITILARSGRAAEVEALAAATPAGSYARLAAGSRLLKLRDHARVRLLLEGTCGAYAGERATLCEKAVEMARAGR